MEGAAPLESQPLAEGARKTADAVNRFASAARAVLAGRERANMVVMRGFSGVPDLPDFGARYKLNPAAIAAYPMYRGLAQLVGMKIIPTGGDFDAELDTLEAVSQDHDFIFLHYKPADAAGEDGDFDAKVHWLEELDARIPRVLATEPDVLVVAGDHSTPAIMASHSWHPVPLLIRSRYTRGEGVGGVLRARLPRRLARLAGRAERDAPRHGPRRQAEQVRAVGGLFRVGDAILNEWPSPHPNLMERSVAATDQLLSGSDGSCTLNASGGCECFHAGRRRLETAPWSMMAYDAESASYQSSVEDEKTQSNLLERTGGRRRRVVSIRAGNGRSSERGHGIAKATRGK